MKKVDQIYAIDLGSSKVAAVAASPDQEGNFCLDEFVIVASRGMFKGAIADVEAVAETIESAIQRLEATLGTKILDLAVGISGTHLSSSNSQCFVPIYPAGRPVRRQDILQVLNNSRQVMMPPDREQVMAVPREFRVDGLRHVAHPVGMGASRLDVITHIVTGRIDAIRKIERVLEKNGRSIDLLIANPLAAGLGVLTPEAMQQGAVVIDIGATTTELAVFSGGSVAYLACIAIGSHHISTDISQLLKVSMHDAERLKLEAGSASPESIGPDETVDVIQVEGEKRTMKRRVLADIISARMKEIAQLSLHHVEKSGLMDELRGGVSLTGGGSLLPGVESIFGEALAPLKIRLGHPKLHGAHSRQVATPTMSVVIGLARYALEGEEQEFAPVSGLSSWKDKIRSLTALFGGSGDGKRKEL